MRVLIVGAGRIGSSLAQNLASENNDVTVVDVDPIALAALEERFDLRTVLGDASSPTVLANAGANDVDLMVCCAAQDSVNLLACYLGREVFNIPRRIARLRTQYYIDEPEFTREKFGVDRVISPEQTITDYLFHLVEFPEVIEIVDFADDIVSLLTIKVAANSPFLDLVFKGGDLRLPDVNGHILEIVRDDRALDLSHDVRLAQGDELVIAVDTEEAHRAVRQIHKRASRARNIMIAGGGHIGERLATMLAAEGCHVRLIEMREQRSDELAKTLGRNIIVLNGNSTDEDLLLDEHIMDMHAFLAVTDADEDNIMASLLAKRLGAQKVITLVSRQSYGELIRGSAIDVAVSPVWTTIGALMRELKRGAIVRGHRLRQGRSEAVEYQVLGDASSSKLVGQRVSAIRWPKHTVVAAIVRAGEMIIPTAETTLEQDDHVIVYARNLSAVEHIDRLFRVSALLI